MAARRKTLQNSSDDYSKIVDLVSRFAIHHVKVGFSCRKVGLLSYKTYATVILLASCIVSYVCYFFTVCLGLLLQSAWSC